MSLAQRLALGGALPRTLRPGPPAVRIGFLAPLTGPLAPWGLPGLEGCRLWADWLNGQGGLTIGAARHPVRILDCDTARGLEATRQGARTMVAQGARIILSLGGDSLAPALPWLMDRGALVSTLLPFDLSPATPSLIAPAEIHPLFVVTSVAWLAARRPDLRRVSLCSQEDLMGLPSLATYRAAFDAAGITRVREVRYSPQGADPAAILAAMLQEGPQILCWCSSEPQMVHALTEAAFHAGFRGPILSCTGDYYPRLVERTSVDFMQDFIFHFPDFDDPALVGRAFFFRQPSGFHASFQARYPGHWSAVSWEYAAILDQWQSAVEIAGSARADRVLDAMKRGGRMMNAFGPARWQGEALFGIDNALIGDWPVVRIQDGRARIQAFGSVLDWLSRHEGLLLDHLQDLGLRWQQRAVSRPG
ncbi:ABC transporter substrate-binding protein [Paracoccus gahaiensis]|nr:ABC transporter substrate-binding protein [Paracoccus gahaiensis]